MKTLFLSSLWSKMSRLEILIVCCLFLYFSNTFYDLGICMSWTDFRTDFAAWFIYTCFSSTRSVMFYMHGPIFVRINFADFYNRLTLFFFVAESGKIKIKFWLTSKTLYDEFKQAYVWNLLKTKFSWPKCENLLCPILFLSATKASNFLFVFGWWSWIPRSRTHDERIWWLTTVQYNHFLYPDFFVFRTIFGATLCIYLKSFH